MSDAVLDTLRAKLSDRYTIERELGRGGMATVYLATDVRHEREVAIKVLLPDLSATIGAERFEREIRLAAKLQHPHILTMYDSGSADGLLYYVMPFVKGESVRDRLDREKQLPLDDAIQIALEVADALGYAHAQGIIHRDIKPENILISNGHALVADFGIASARSEAGQSRITQTGMAVGTPVYMSPEQATGETVGPTADLYSLGCMLYEMLSGEPPFTAKTPTAIMAKHAMEMVPSVRIVRASVPEEVEEAIFAAMEKSPADRPKNAAAFTEMLGVPLGATATRRSISRYTATRRVPSGAQRALETQVWWRRTWVIAVGVAVVLAGVAGALTMAGVFEGQKTVDPLARKVAVLYFADGSPNGELREVADRLTDALIRDLQGVQQLSVVSRNGVEQYRDSDLPKEKIAELLGAGTLVAGSVRPLGRDRVRVTTSLIDRSGADFDRTNIDVRRDSLFSAEEAVAGQVANKLRELLGNEIALRETRAGTGSLVAWTSFSRAEKARRDAEQLGASRRDSATARAAEADSLLAAAQAADGKWIEPTILRGDVAYLRYRLALEKEDKGKWLDSAMLYAERALTSDATNAKALALRGTVKYAQWRLPTITDRVLREALLEDARKDLEGAVKTDRTLAPALATLTFLFYDKKDVYASLRRAREAYEADAFLSNTPLILNRLFWGAYDTRGFKDARTSCEDGARRFPNNPLFASCQLWLLLVPGTEPNVAEARRLAHLVDSLSTPAAKAKESRIAQLVVGGVSGRRAMAAAPGPARVALLDSANRVIVAARGDRTIDPSQELKGYEAVMRVQLGEYDKAISLLNEYVTLNPTHSFCVEGNVHWWWADLTTKPGFAKLMTSCTTGS